MKHPLKPYMFKAYYNYFTDNGEKVYMQVDSSYIGPAFEKEFKTFINPQTHIICFNITTEALGRIEITEESVVFQARFNGEVKDVFVPMGAIVALLTPSSNLYVGLPDDPSYHQTDSSDENSAKKSPELKLVGGDEPAEGKKNADSEGERPKKSRKRSSSKNAFKLL